MVQWAQQHDPAEKPSKIRFTTISGVARLDRGSGNEDNSVSLLEDAFCHVIPPHGPALGQVFGPDNQRSAAT